MTALNPQMGYDNALYVNTGTYAVPVWTEIDLARDLQHGLDVAGVDVSCRRTARNGREAEAAGLGKWMAEFDSIVPDANETNTGYDDLLTANRNRTTVDILVVEGGTKDTDGADATRAICNVLGGRKSEPLKDAATRNFRCSLALNGDQAIELYGTMSSGEFVPGS